MYNELLLDTGYFYKVNKATIKKFSLGKTIKSFQNGEYDKNILCDDCENNILCKEYENYAAQVYSLIENRKSSGETTIESFVNINGIKGKRIKNINYSKFKLFLLTILWRSSICKRSFFNNVSLGKKHEEIIRNMIYTDNPGEIKDYPCFICDLNEDEPILKGIIARPLKLKREGNISYVFMVSGIFYEFTISKHNPPYFAREGVIDMNDEMTIWIGPNDTGKYYLREFRKHYFKS